MRCEIPALPDEYRGVLRGIASGNDMGRRMRRHAPFQNKTGPEGQARWTGGKFQEARSRDELRTGKGNHRTKVRRSLQQLAVRHMLDGRHRRDQCRAARGRFLGRSLFGPGAMRTANTLGMMFCRRINDRGPGAVIAGHQPRQSETTKRRQLDQPRLSDCVHQSLVTQPGLFCN